MRLHYTTRGKGDVTLVFLHYFGGAVSTWNEVIDRLENEYSCIAVDLLGFGKSPSQESLISIDDSADAMISLLAELHLTKYVLLGHSMGGKIALRLASLQPKGLLGLILLAPSPPTAEPMTDKERKNMEEAFGNKEKVKKMIEDVTAKPLPEELFEREITNNLSVSSVGWHSWPQLGSKEIIAEKMNDIHVAVTILYGANDKKFTKPFLKREFDHYFKTYRLVEIKDSGHLLPVEVPVQTADEIRKALL